MSLPVSLFRCSRMLAVSCLCLQLGCNESTRQGPGDPEVITSTTDTATLPEDMATYDEPAIDLPPPPSARLEFPGYTIVFHQFSGYSFRMQDEKVSIEVGPGGTYPPVDMNTLAKLKDLEDMERYGNPDEWEDRTIVITGDSMYLSENVGENTLLNTLLEIIPQHPEDEFRLTYRLHTIIAESAYSLTLASDELYKEFERSRLLIRDYTNYYPVKDSARYFFRLSDPGYESDPADYFDCLSETRFQAEYKRMQKKFGFRDTLVQYSSEGGSYYDLFVKNGKLFSFDSSRFEIKIEQLRKGNWISTKYVLVEIARGC